MNRDIFILSLRSWLVFWSPEIDRVLRDKRPIAVKNDRFKLPVLEAAQFHPDDMTGFPRNLLPLPFLPVQTSGTHRSETSSRLPASRDPTICDDDRAFGKVTGDTRPATQGVGFRID